MEAIISSMTRYERQHPEIINGSRRQRIAKGSGTTVQEVNRLLKQFDDTRKMMKRRHEHEKPHEDDEADAPALKSHTPATPTERISTDTYNR